jgi:hypothetical protein
MGDASVAMRGAGQQTPFGALKKRNSVPQESKRRSSFIGFWGPETESPFVVIHLTRGDDTARANGDRNDKNENLVECT